MRKIVCRHCELLHSSSTRFSSVGAGGARNSFVIPGSKPHYAPDLPFKLEHVKLDVSVDPRGKVMTGVATQKFRVIAESQTRLRLDQIGLEISEVKVNGKKCSFTTEEPALWIELASAPKRGAELEVAVEYVARNPRRGLYFTGPDADYPKKRYQVWSQGQDEDAKYWFPTLDYPNQKATSEVIATVPKGFTAVSNGALVSKKELSSGTTQFHYKIGTPHVTYLIALTVAEFSEWAHKGPRGLPVQYFVEPGREADGRRAFDQTPKMIEAFERVTGVDYPYEKYSQVAVQDFIFGGMENTSATTQTDLTLHDERAHLDFSSDGLVSHELAHQWFGDLVTCRDWSHGWLNEGFATFMERIWIENDTSPEGGADEAKYYGYQDLKDHLAEDNGKYRRAIVCNTYIEPIDLFDTHLYQKGGLVLNLLRAQLGEKDFWASVNHYLKKHRGGSVETLDLIRAIEETTGRNMRRFFDQWVFGPGYPEFELSYSWHGDRKLVELVIEQKQARKPESGDDPAEAAKKAPLFQLPVSLEITLEGGRVEHHVIELEQARERVFLSVDGRPLRVRFDPGNTIPKTIKFPRPKEMLLEHLANDPDIMGRIEAARELIAIADATVVAALGRAALKDSFWGVQAEAAAALSAIRTESARDALIAALGVKHSKARRAVVAALGSFHGEESAQALRALARKDASYSVEAEATTAYLHARLDVIPRPDAAAIAEVEGLLSEQLKKPSYREVIRGAALRGLAALPGISRGERPQALETVIEWTRRGYDLDARMAAIVSLGAIARSSTVEIRARALELLDRIADEDSMRIRLAVIVAIRQIGSPEGISIANKIRANDVDGRVRREAQVTASNLAESGSTPEIVSTLREHLAKLEEDYRKLASKFEVMEGASGSASPKKARVSKARTSRALRAKAGSRRKRR
jgi:aminopeptidase N